MLMSAFMETTSVSSPTRLEFAQILQTFLTMATAKMRESAKDCMVYEERASTPPEIRKYRRSTNLEPGMRFKHHGVVDDYQNMNLDEKIYGMTENNRSRVGASDLINQKRPTELERINAIKAEKVYKQQNREPLGHMPDRGYKLPDKYTTGE
jgi:hypothetical protein